jgi:hypothetical protein
LTGGIFFSHRNHLCFPMQRERIFPAAHAMHKPYAVHRDIRRDAR